MSELDVRDFPVKEIYADADFNCRGEFSPAEVHGLSQDIAKNGLMNPVTITECTEAEKIKSGKPYKLVAGFRRFMAFQVLEKELIPCNFKSGMDQARAKLYNLAENLQRRELNILQEAQAVKSLLDIGLHREEISKELNMSPGWVQVRQMLITFPRDIQLMVASGELTQENVRQLYALGDDDSRYKAIREIKDAKLQGKSVRKLDFKHNSPKTAKKERSRPDIFRLQQHIRQSFGNSTLTSLLAWTAGEISDSDVFDALVQHAEDMGEVYNRPNGTVADMDLL